MFGGYLRRIAGGVAPRAGVPRLGPLRSDIGGGLSTGAPRPRPVPSDVGGVLSGGASRPRPVTSNVGVVLSAGAPGLRPLPSVALSTGGPRIPTYPTGLGIVIRAGSPSPPSFASGPGCAHRFASCTIDLPSGAKGDGSSMPGLTANQLWLNSLVLAMVSQQGRELHRLRQDTSRLSLEFSQAASTYKDVMSEAQRSVGTAVWRIMIVFGSFGLSVLHMLSPPVAPPPASVGSAALAVTPVAAPVASQAMPPVAAPVASQSLPPVAAEGAKSGASLLPKSVNTDSNTDSNVPEVKDKARTQDADDPVGSTGAVGKQN